LERHEDGDQSVVEVADDIVERIEHIDDGAKNIEHNDMIGKKGGRGHVSFTK
jgi:hypothetical protein